MIKTDYLRQQFEDSYYTRLLTLWSKAKLEPTPKDIFFEKEHGEYIRHYRIQMQWEGWVLAMQYVEKYHTVTKRNDTKEVVLVSLQDEEHNFLEILWDKSQRDLD